MVRLIPRIADRYKRIMEPRAARELGSHLASDEKLLWAGSPDRLRYALHGLGISWAGMVLATLLVALWWLLVLLAADRFLELDFVGYLMLLVATPLLVFGCALTAKPIRRYGEARHVAYGLTDRRAVILVGGRNSRIEDAAPSRFVEPVVTRHGNGSATVLFLSAGRPGGRSGAGAEDVEELGGFVAIRHAKALETELARLRGASD